MMLGKSYSYFALAFAAGTLSACTNEWPDRADTAKLPKAPQSTFSWQLPKTVLSVTMTIEPISCVPVGGEPVVETNTTLTVVLKGVPDPDIDPKRRPDGLISFNVDQFESFWQDRNITLKTYPASHLLQEISSKPTNQVGAMAGNAITGVSKLVGFALPFLALISSPCGDLTGKLSEIGVLREQLRTSSGLSAKERDGILAELAAKLDAVTITVKKNIDPETDSRKPEVLAMAAANQEIIGDPSEPIQEGSESKVDPTKLVAVLHPTQKQFEVAHWYTEQYREDVGNDPTKMLDNLSVRAYLDFTKATPNKLGVVSARDFRRPVFPIDALYREVAYVPVLFFSEKIETNAPLPGSGRFPFAQFGQPSTLPLRAGAFKSYDWGLAFNELGEMTTGAFGSKATGVGVTAIFAGAATATAQGSADYRTAAGGVDADTLRLQAENAAMLAKINHLTYKKQLLDLENGEDEAE